MSYLSPHELHGVSNPPPPPPPSVSYMFHVMTCLSHAVSYMFHVMSCLSRAVSHMYCSTCLACLLLGIMYFSCWELVQWTLNYPALEINDILGVHYTRNHIEFASSAIENVPISVIRTFRIAKKGAGVQITEGPLYMFCAELHVFMTDVYMFVLLHAVSCVIFHAE